VSLWGLDPTTDRFAIRAMRSRPPGRAAHDPVRRKVFSAALGQFDELLDAAGVAGPASRPLPLYYALNQAGRAIVAAFQDPGKKWVPTQHGLIARMSEHGDLQTVSIKTQPRASEGGSVHLLSEALDSPRLQHPTSLANVWAAIPGFPSPGLGGGCLRPLQLNVQWGGFEGGYRALLRVEHPYAPPKLDKSAIGDLIRKGFPRAAPGLIVKNVTQVPDHFHAFSADICWKNKDGTQIHPKLRAHQYLGNWWLLPRLNRHADVLSGLMLWWTLLLTLSEIARYHPAEWASALDPDDAWTTVPIEQVLQNALEIVPHLVVEALQRSNQTI
jgi:hypothetical protein